jgi:outer membrane protein
MRFRLTLFAALIVLASGRSFAADAPVFTQSLSDALQKAKEKSADLKASTSLAEAAHHQADASHAALYPNLSIQGAQYYQTEVPALSLGSFGAFSLGTHDNYYVGPVLSYNLFDGGKDRANAKSFMLLAKARDTAAATQEQLLMLNVRQAYFRVQYALKQVTLTADLLKLSSAQRKDIDLRFKEGSSSRLDQVQAHRDVTSNALRFQQAQNELSTSFRDLMGLLGTAPSADASFPIPDGFDSDYPETLPPPTLKIHLDALDATLASYQTQSVAPSYQNHPEVQALEFQVASSKLAAESEKAALWPTLQLQAREQYQYPNAIIPENTWQGIFGASLSIPLFEGNNSRNRSAQRLSESQAFAYQREQRITDLTRFSSKALETLASLKDQKKESEENVRQAQEVERLTYDSYKSGESRYLDVQDADVRLLQSEVSEAQLESAILSQIALLEYLSAR